MNNYIMEEHWGDFMPKLFELVYKGDNHDVDVYLLSFFEKIIRRYPHRPDHTTILNSDMFTLTMLCIFFDDQFVYWLNKNMLKVTKQYKENENFYLLDTCSDYELMNAIILALFQYVDYSHQNSKTRNQIINLLNEYNDKYLNFKLNFTPV